MKQFFAELWEIFKEPPAARLFRMQRESLERMNTLRRKQEMRMTPPAKMQPGDIGLPGHRGMVWGDLFNAEWAGYPESER
jgi:hypothetical protein